MLNAVCVCKGIAIGRAHWINSSIDYDYSGPLEVDSEEECTKVKSSFKLAKNETSKIVQEMNNINNDEASEIFRAHEQILSDPVLLENIILLINENNISAVEATKLGFKSFIDQLLEIPDVIFQGRVADLEDTRDLILRILIGVEEDHIPKEPKILVGENITPSTLIKFGQKMVQALLSTEGATSHVAIIASSMGIPTIMGIESQIKKINNGDLLIVDALEKNIFINPDSDLLNTYKKKKEAYDDYCCSLEQFKNLPCCTYSGDRVVEAFGNIALPEEAENIDKFGGEGIGLFRSEFLFMDKNDWPSEEEQFQSYKKVLLALKSKPVTIRTLDVGGDKDIDYMSIKKEENPFLGKRAIRISLEQPDKFLVQLRALLRASAYGNLRIMFPMIATLEEIKQAKNLLNKAKRQLDQEKIEYASKIQVGMMIEIPSAALLADVFAKQVDFFSIGTNDLLQYTVAADRTNKEVEYLADYLNPAVLILINRTIKAGHNNNIPVAMCGEMAGDLEALPILLGLGLDEFSMSPSKILEFKNKLSKLDYSNAKILAEEALQLETASEVHNLLGRGGK